MNLIPTVGYFDNNIKKISKILDKYFVIKILIYKLAIGSRE